MHYYKRNIGDYHKKAGRLSILQHGAYTLLIDSCYDREVFPTMEKAIDWCWASSKEEIEADVDNISALFTNEGVYLFVRYDLRRIYIWKGPKSPVRKRFISSRVGSKIQEASSKIGMHLKIVSVDAGDEPVEFLRNFKIESYNGFNK